jgi:hypothetical protein
MELRNEAGVFLTPGRRVDENERNRSMAGILENCDLNFCFHLELFNPKPGSRLPLLLELTTNLCLPN